MKFILYSSDAKLSDVDLQQLLAAAIEKNARLNVTGFLMSHSSGFIQYIEGEASTLDDLYEEIRADKRHCHINTLLEANIEQRMYQDWSMGHVYIDDDQMIEQLKCTDGLALFEILKARTLFLYPNDFSTQQA